MSRQNPDLYDTILDHPEVSVQEEEQQQEEAPLPPIPAHRSTIVATTGSYTTPFAARPSTQATAPALPPRRYKLESPASESPSVTDTEKDDSHIYDYLLPPKGANPYGAYSAPHTSGMYAAAGMPEPAAPDQSLRFYGDETYRYDKLSPLPSPKQVPSPRALPPLPAAAPLSSLASPSLRFGDVGIYDDPDGEVVRRDIPRTPPRHSRGTATAGTADYLTPEPAYILPQGAVTATSQPYAPPLPPRGKSPATQLGLLNIPAPTPLAAAPRLSPEDTQILREIATVKLANLPRTELAGNVSIEGLHNDLTQQISFITNAQKIIKPISDRLNQAESALTPARRSTISRAFGGKPKEKDLSDEKVQTILTAKRELNNLTANLLPVIAFIKNSITSETARATSDSSSLLLQAAENVEKTLFGLAIGDLTQDRAGINGEARNLFFVISCNNLKAIATMITNSKDKEFYRLMLEAAVQSGVLTGEQKQEVRHTFPDLLHAQVAQGSFVSATAFVASRGQSSSTPHLGPISPPERGTSAPTLPDQRLYDLPVSVPAPRPAPSVPGAPSPAPHNPSHSASPAQSGGQHEHS